MASAENAKLEYEAGQTSYPQTELTPAADAINFASAVSLWSAKVGYAPVVRPNGLSTGGVVTPAATVANNTVDVSALTANIAGVAAVPVAAAINQTITRAGANVSKISSVTVTSAGSIAIVAGTDGADATLSETRGAAGGPPFIPVGSIELAQVRYTSNVAAAVTAAQIFAVVGVHTEMANYPLSTIDYATGKVVFSSAVPKIHTGSLPKKVFASFASPIFAELAQVSDFVPPETSHSVGSTQIYGGTIGNTSSSLGQGSFKAYFEDGVSDGLVSQKNFILWFRFYPDKFKAPYMLAQGKLGIARTFPVADGVQAACTISASKAATEVAG